VTVKEFINQVFLDEYNRIVNQGFHYISFALVGLGIEFLGGCLDPYDFGETRLSKARFTNALKMLFPQGYQQHSNALYEDLRSALAHQFRPGSRFWLTHSEESQRENTQHLGAFKGGTVLIAENFYQDFSDACKKVIEMIDKGTLTHPKSSGQFLKIT
jgi:hypothetical protein